MGKVYTDAQKRASLKYQADTVAIQIRVKPEQRDKYKLHAENKGISLNSLIINLLDKDIKEAE